MEVNVLNVMLVSSPKIMYAGLVVVHALNVLQTLGVANVNLVHTLIVVLMNV